MFPVLAMRDDCNIVGVPPPLSSDMIHAVCDFWKTATAYEPLAGFQPGKRKERGVKEKGWVCLPMSRTPCVCDVFGVRRSRLLTVSAAVFVRDAAAKWSPAVSSAPG